jgi:hypothetical protein
MNQNIVVHCKNAQPHIILTKLQLKMLNMFWFIVLGRGNGEGDHSNQT